MICQVWELVTYSCLGWYVFKRELISCRGCNNIMVCYTYLYIVLWLAPESTAALGAQSNNLLQTFKAANGFNCSL